MSLVFFSSGIAFFFDLNVVFERFINVLNIKNIQMIDVNTKSSYLKCWKPNSTKDKKSNLVFS